MSVFKSVLGPSAIIQFFSCLNNEKILIQGQSDKWAYRTKKNIPCDCAVVLFVNTIYSMKKKNNIWNIWYQFTLVWISVILSVPGVQRGCEGMLKPSDILIKGRPEREMPCMTDSCDRQSRLNHNSIALNASNSTRRIETWHLELDGESRGTEVWM